MEILKLAFVVLVIVSMVKAYMSYKLKHDDPQKWAAIREAEEREKAAKLAGRANAVNIGWSLFKTFRR